MTVKSYCFCFRDEAEKKTDIFIFNVNHKKVDDDDWNDETDN